MSRDAVPSRDHRDDDARGEQDHPGAVPDDVVRHKIDSVSDLVHLKNLVIDDPVPELETAETGPRRGSRAGDAVRNGTRTYT